MINRYVLVLALMFILSIQVFCANTGDFKYSIGLDNPFIGLLQRNSSGQIDADLGVSLGIGISYKRYFSSLKFNRDFDPSITENLSPFWAVGTFALVMPYVGVGVDYAWNNGFYLGLGIIATSAIRYVGPGYMGYVGPEIHGGMMF
jgi:hypothetical protein